MGLSLVAITAGQISVTFAAVHFSFSACGPTLLRAGGRSSFKCFPELLNRVAKDVAEQGDHIVAGAEDALDSDSGKGRGVLRYVVSSSETPDEPEG